MKIRIAGGILESCQNGEGIRNVVFFSGCTRNCKNCHNKAMQDKNYGDIVTVNEVIDYLLNNDSKDIIDGVTISGGEPFEQPFSLLKLVKKLKQADINIWIYSGDLYEHIAESPLKMEILKNIDVLVDGDFKQELVTAKRYRGSDNQRLIRLKEGEAVDIE